MHADCTKATLLGLQVAQLPFCGCLACSSSSSCPRDQAGDGRTRQEVRPPAATHSASRRVGSTGFAWLARACSAFCIPPTRSHLAGLSAAKPDISDVHTWVEKMGRGSTLSLHNVRLKAHSKAHRKHASTADPRAPAPLHGPALGTSLVPGTVADPPRFVADSHAGTGHGGSTACGRGAQA